MRAGEALIPEVPPESPPSLAHPGGGEMRAEVAGAVHGDDAITQARRAMQIVNRQLTALQGKAWQHEECPQKEVSSGWGEETRGGPPFTPPQMENNWWGQLLAPFTLSGDDGLCCDSRDMVCIPKYFDARNSQQPCILHLLLGSWPGRPRQLCG